MNKKKLLRCCLGGVLTTLTATAVGDYKIPIVFSMYIYNQLPDDTIEVEEPTFMPCGAFILGTAPVGKIKKNMTKRLVYYAPNSELSKAALSFAIKVPRANKRGTPGYCVLSLNFDKLQTEYPTFTTSLSNQRSGHACTDICSNGTSHLSPLQNKTFIVSTTPGVTILQIAVNPSCAQSKSEGDKIS